MAAGECGEIDSVQRTIKQEVGAIMAKAGLVHPIAQADFAQQFGDAMFQHPGADAGLDIVARVALQHHAVDAGPRQEMSEHQPSRPGADDADLRPPGHGERSDCSMPS